VSHLNIAFDRYVSIGSRHCNALHFDKLTILCYDIDRAYRYVQEKTTSTNLNTKFCSYIENPVHDG